MCSQVRREPVALSCTIILQITLCTGWKVLDEPRPYSAAHLCYTHTPHSRPSRLPRARTCTMYHDLKLVLDGTLATQLRQWSRLWRNNYATCCGFPAANASTFSLVPPIASTLR